MWKLLVLFAGVVFMVNGCNGLVSGSFGTHKLRTLTFYLAVNGVGDADFLEVTGALLGPLMVVDSVAPSEAVYLYFPIVAADQTTTERSAHEATRLVGWMKRGEMQEVNEDTEIKGFVSRPDRLPTNLLQQFKDTGFAAETPITYLHLGERPLAWSWQLLMFLAGLGLSLAAAYVSGRPPAPE